MSAAPVDCATRSGRRFCLVVLLFVLLGGAAATPAQSSLPLDFSSPTFGDRAARTSDDPFTRSMQQKILRKVNEDRQKHLLADTERLLALTTELDAELAATHPPALNSAQQGKLVEIQRLARQIRKRMNEWTTFEESNRFNRSMMPSWQ